MKRCPKCNCGAEFTNKAEYYAKNAGGLVAGLAVGFGASLIMGNHGAHVGHTVTENLTKEVKKHYKCTNSRCEYEWDEE